MLIGGSVCSGASQPPSKDYIRSEDRRRHQLTELGRGGLVASFAQ